MKFMEATREIYWNVGHGVIIPMYCLAVAAGAVLVRGFLRRLPTYRLGKPLNRFDRYEERARNMIDDIFGQEKVARVRDGGLPHNLFFWGFMVLFAGTLMVMFQVDFFTPLMGVNILSGEFYKAFSLVLDIAGLVAIVMLAALFVRRYFVKPEALETRDEDFIAHTLLFSILITGFLIEGARMAATEIVQNPPLADFSPVGKLFAQPFMGFDEPSIRLSHKAFWWVHLLLVLGFFCAIPYTKLRHIFTTGINGFFIPFEPRGSIATIDLEDESREQYGAAKVTDLTWKDIFDADACTVCMRCQDRCPAWATGKPLSPMKVVQQVGETAFASPEAGLCGVVTEDVLWACTTCYACQDICPANIEHVNKILEMRRNMTLMEGTFPGEEVRTATGNYEVNGNPFGLGFATRGDWAEGLPVSIMADGADVDILYFVGCYASFDRRNQEVARSFVRICDSAGIRVGILGKEEKCCGEPSRKLGNEYLYQMMAKENIELMKGYGVKKIVATCPHCFNTLARDYRDLGLDVPVEHYTTYLHDLLKKGSLKLEAEPFAFTYHDSCYIGRYMDIVDQPRSILSAAGGRITEMEKSRYDSFCCGGGGGRILAEEKIGTRICEARITMARETGSPLLVSNCPFCLTMFEDGIKTGGSEGEIVVKDLAEIVAERIRN
jgi:Fe-S oxidoreductase/nitrate reductase gamma subunit